MPPCIKNRIKNRKPEHYKTRTVRPVPQQLPVGDALVFLETLTLALSVHSPQVVQLHLARLRVFQVASAHQENTNKKSHPSMAVASFHRICARVCVNWNPTRG